MTNQMHAKLSNKLDLQVQSNNGYNLTLAISDLGSYVSTFTSVGVLLLYRDRTQRLVQRDSRVGERTGG